MLEAPPFTSKRISWATLNPTIKILQSPQIDIFLFELVIDDYFKRISKIVDILNNERIIEYMKYSLIFHIWWLKLIR